MAWTSLTFAYGSVLTSTKMTQLYDNFGYGTGSPAPNFTAGITGTTAAFTGAVSAASYGAVSGTTGTFSGAVSGTTLSGSAAGMPKFSAYRGTSNQSVTSAVNTKVQLNTELFDTNSNFDSATNYRFTPTVAGYYSVAWDAYCGANAGTLTKAFAGLYKNGTIYSAGVDYDGAAITHFTSHGSTVVFMNGSTDYLEIYANITGTTPYLAYGTTEFGCKLCGALLP